MDVLIVDDQRSNLLIFSKLVERAAECVAHQFRDPLAALLATHSRTFDLVLVDYRMPGMDGISLLKQIRELPRYADVPIVMITADGDREVVRAALQAGATEFVSKPVDPVEFHHRIKNLLQLRNAQLQLQRHTQELETRVVRSVETIAEREIEIIQRLSRAAERRDNETGNHVVRMALLSRIIAEGMGLSENTAKTLYVAAPLHDVGKIGLPDSILLKPGPLTAEERREMERHTLVGHEILAGAAQSLFSARLKSRFITTRDGMALDTHTGLWVLQFHSGPVLRPWRMSVTPWRLSARTSARGRWTTFRRISLRRRARNSTPSASMRC